AVSPHLTPAVRAVLTVAGSLASRDARGGTAPARVTEQLTRVRELTDDARSWSADLPVMR
ncbi:MAG: argininosuccinate lyase, partial [Phycicoccus sp.]